ncbi:CAP domain-containing protein [Candidatus Uhrbacteria bacterium]|nr:CAP domain-containing protein [Candidatus Uhrbacteria bacterium]
MHASSFFFDCRSVARPILATLAALALLAMPRFVISSGIRADTILRYTNQARALVAAPPLRTDIALTIAAQQRAEEMIAHQYFAHERPNGSSFATAAREAQYPFERIAENLAIAYTEELLLVHAWQASVSHRDVLLHPPYTDTGIGIASGMYRGVPTTVVVQFFGERRPPALRSWQPLPSALAHS